LGVEKEIRVPAIGDFDNVEVIEVLVAPGDIVDVEDTLITIESDKASMEIPSPAAGVIEKISVTVGERVSEGTLIALLAPAEPTAEQSPPKDEENAVSGEAPVTRGRPDSAPKPPPRSAPAPMPPTTTSGKVHASPSVRHFARKLGVDLTRVGGAGRKGRIIRDDVENYVKQALRQGSPSADLAHVLQVEPARSIDFAEHGEIEIVEMKPIRRIAAKLLHRSWVTIPHVTQFDEADISDLEALRKSMQSEGAERGVKLTLLAFLMKAVVICLKDFPRFCASLDDTGEKLVLKRYYHIGFAVDTPNGLVVPVVRDVDRKDVFELADKITELSAGAHSRRLQPADLAGGCFSISSLGGIGGTAFTPIVNAPEVAVLGVSRHALKPVYVGDALTPRLTLPLSLSYDHRVVDGADAARFTTRLVEVLENTDNLTS
jgi:pyruvate dehydrogenase E2 component (dihydrolipoamide acetyltransferase)